MNSHSQVTVLDAGKLGSKSANTSVYKGNESSNIQTHSSSSEYVEVKKGQDLGFATLDNLEKLKDSDIHFNTLDL